MQILTKKNIYLYFLEKYSKYDPICNQRYQRYVHMYTMERYMMASQIHVSLVSNCTGDEKLSDFFGLMRTLIIIQK